MNEEEIMEEMIKNYEQQIKILEKKITLIKSKLKERENKDKKHYVLNFPNLNYII